MRALLVDDSNDIRMTTAWALFREGVETVVVRLGREVPGMIKSFQPDVLILDLSHAEVNGSMIASLLRENWPDLPIILAAEASEQEIYLPPRTESLVKPYSIDALVESIVRLTHSPSSDL